MSEAEGAGAALPPAPTPKRDPESLVLRARPRPVVRFRKGVIVAAAALVSASLIGLTWIALDPPSLKIVAQGELPQPLGSSAPDALAEAPATYGDVPILGPPLPGDLGRPILDKQRDLAAGTLQESGAAAPLDHSGEELAAERQRQLAAEQAARTSPLVVQMARAPQPQGEPATPAPVAAAPGPVQAARELSGQERKLTFASRGGEDAPALELQASASPWVVAAGTIIPASLLTGLNSDLPGMVLAQVTENVRDSVTGRTILIPQGSRLIGRYDSAVDFGQARALVVWERILFPDGASIGLDKMPATDAGGYAGVKDRVDAHGWQLFKAAALSSLLGVGAELTIGGESELVRAIRETGQQGSARAGEQLVSRTLDIQPTLTVRPGWPVRVLVNRDIVLKPWEG